MSIQLPLSQTWPDPALYAAPAQPQRTDKVTAVAPTGSQSGNTGSTDTKATQHGPTDKAAKNTLFADSEEGASFWDFLDVINPLQHIPVVSTIYREITGDEIGAGARVLGGAMFGPLGLISGALDVAMSEITGDTLGGHVVAMFSGDETTDGQPETALASAEGATPPSSNGVMTAADSGILLPLSPAPRNAISTATPPAPSLPATADTATLLAAQEAGSTPAATALKQPGYMPLKRDEPTFMPLGNQPHAMPLNPAAPTRPSAAATASAAIADTSTLPPAAVAAMPPGGIQPDPASILRAMAQQGLTIETVPLTRPSSTAQDDETNAG